MIAECHAQLIGLEAAIVGQVQGDQSWADELGDVVALDCEPEHRHRVAGVALQLVDRAGQVARHAGEGGIDHRMRLSRLPAVPRTEPSRSVRPSSMRLSSRENSIRRGVPSAKKSVRVSVTRSITHRP